MSRIKWSRTDRKHFEEVKRFFLGVCVCCRGGSSLINVERDHIVPTSKGGLNIISNWQPLCALCNIKKYTKTIDYRISFCEDFNLVMPKEWLQKEEGFK